MNNGIGRIIAIAFSVATVTATSSAWAVGGFAGASYGKSDVDRSITEGLITSGPVDGKDSGLKVFVGMQFNRNLGLEFAVVDLGELTYSGTFNGSPVSNGKVEASGFNVAAVGTIPLSPQLSVFGKAGLFSWEADATDTTSGVPFSGTEDGTDISLGVGLEFDFTNVVGARMEWERFDVDNADASLLSVGVVFKW